MLYDFLMLLRRYKVSSVLNIAGMGLAFAAAYLMLVQVVFDFSYNRSLPDAADIYRLEYPSWYTDGSWGTSWNRHNPVEYCQGIPEVAAAATFRCDGYTNRDYSIRRNDTIDNITMNSANCERAGLDVFCFECVAGSLDDFIGPYTAVVSESAAKRYGINVGDVIHSGRGATEGSHTLTVVAIYRDFPEPSSVAKNDMYMGMIPLEQHDRSNWNDPFYLRLKPGSSPEAVEKKMADHWREQAANEGYTQEEIEREIAGYAPRLNNVRDLYFSKDVEYNDGLTGNIATTYTLLSIAVLIIVIAFINFINFFFALIPVRIRAVNTRKIFGASNARLRMGFVAETVGLFVVALAVGYGLVVILNDTQMASYLSTSAAIGKNLPLALGFVAVAVVAGILISLYPIFYITSFSPAFVIKGSFQATRSGRVLRYTLVGVQYVISISLIIVTLFIQMQHNYMMNYDMGFDKGGILAVDGPTITSYQQMDALSDKLRQNPMVTDVTFSAGDIVAPQRMGWGREFRDKRISFQSYPVAWNFLDFMGIKVVEGRDFTKDDYQRANGVFIFNESAKRAFEFTLDDKLNGHADNTDIVGFCEDFHFKPLQYGVEPFCFYVFGSSPWYYPSHVYVRIAAGTGIREAIRYVREAVMAFDPSLEADKVYVRIFDEELGKYYDAEERLARLIAAFSLLSIVISMLGVFGLVLFETQYRRKEIGIRRVNGASVGSILKMFNMQFLRIVGICTVIALPISYYIVDRWLQGFATRMPMHWWVFVLAVMIVAAITALTVTARSWRAANENPINAIQH